MAKAHDCVIKMVSLKGECARGHKIGDEWLASNMLIPGGICLNAFASIYPDLRTLVFNGSFPWGKDADSCLVACPDPENAAVFEIRRIKK